LRDIFLVQFAHAQNPFGSGTVSRRENCTVLELRGFFMDKLNKITAHIMLVRLKLFFAHQLTDNASKRQVADIFEELIDLLKMFRE